MQEERCCECDDLTGRAGRADDSLFYETADGDEIGPLCDECYHRLRSDAFGGVQLIAEDMRAENARLRRQVERLVALLEKEFVSFMVPMLIAQGIDKRAAKISAREAWKTADAKQKADAILTDEPDAATAIDKAAKTTENTGG